jgi:hypothetical protein
MSFLSLIGGSQTYKNHLVVRTPLYRHTTIISHEFSPNKRQRRNCTAALQHLEVWPPSKGLCSFLRNRPSRLARKRELASDIITQIVALENGTKSQTHIYRLPYLWYILDDLKLLFPDFCVHFPWLYLHVHNIIYCSMFVARERFQTYE